VRALNFSDPKLDELLSRLIPEFQPTKVFLFGSRANGNSQSHSDYDLMLIVKSSHLSRRERMIKALKLIWGSGVATDIFVYTEDEFNNWKDEFSSIPHTVANEGLELKVG
jgi:predicted nucleotidyltransferase